MPGRGRIRGGDRSWISSSRSSRCLSSGARSCSLALLLAIYRIGFYVPLPIVNQSQLKNWEEQQSGNTAGKLFGTVAMFGGTSIGMSTIFGLGIMPYISASIIFQLLASVVPSLEAMMKEGESGRKRINEYTRYATVVLCAVQSAFWVQYMMSPQMNVVLQRYHTVWNGFVCVCIMTAGTIFLMWIGEQIDEYGIGNGISLLIMAGILARLPVAITGPNGLWYNATSKLNAEPGKYGITTILLLIGLFIAVVVGVIAITESQRRIPTQSAKHVRGRRVYGGTKQFLPLKVNQAGVMPIIFASSLLIFPSFVFTQPGAGHHESRSPIAGRSARSSPGYSAIWPMPSSGRATSTRFAT